jgi:Na+/melibiose symporter-like transporter
VFEQLVLKIGTYMLIYIALIFSQVVYSEIYERSNPEQKSKRKRKWADPIQEWVIERASRVASALDQWSINRQGRQRTRSVQAITYQMQRPRAASNQLTSLMVCAVVAMQASGSSQYENMAMFNTNSEPIGEDNRCTGCISNKVEDFEGPLIDSG